MQRWLDFDDLALCCSKNLQRRGGALQRTSDFLNQAIDRGVISKRIMMAQGQALRPRILDQFDRVFDRAVAPSHLGRVFSRGVLRVVDK